MRLRAIGGWPLTSWLLLALSVAAFVASSRGIWRSSTLPLPLAVPMSAGVTVENAGSVLAVGDTRDQTGEQQILRFAQDDKDAAELSRDPFRAGGLLPNDLARMKPAPDSVLPVSVAAVRLLGTVVRTGGSFALCQLPADVPRIVHVGERLGELTLISLEQGHAVFQAPRGARLDLFLSNTRS